MSEETLKQDYTKPYSWSPMNMTARYHYNANKFALGIKEKYAKTDDEIREIIKAFNKSFEVSTPEAVWGFMADWEVDELIENPTPVYKAYNTHEFYITPSKPVEIQWKDEPDFSEYYMQYPESFISRFEAYGCVNKSYWFFIEEDEERFARYDNLTLITRNTNFIDRGYDCCRSCFLESKIHKKTSKQVDIQFNGYARCHKEEDGNKERDKFIEKALKNGKKVQSWEFNKISNGFWEARKTGITKL